MANTELVNHVFVDFENVQTLDFTGFGERIIKLTLFLGEKQKRLDTNLVEQLLQHAANVEMVRLTSVGKNALDFTLSYYLGRAVSGDPTGFFHVISKDKGFDPLVAHLRRRHVKASRHADFSAVIEHIAKGRTTTPTNEKTGSAALAPPPIFQSAALPAPNLSIDDVLTHMKRQRAHQPTRRDKLCTMLKSHFHLGDPKAEEIITTLTERGVVTVDGKGKVAYKL